MVENWNCGGAGPHAAGTVKKLPLGGGANGILCRLCWAREIAYRRERNKTLGEFARFDLPSWESGEVYE